MSILLDQWASSKILINYMFNLVAGTDRQNI